MVPRAPAVVYTPFEKQRDGASLKIARYGDGRQQ
jgi:hypothetical protein